MIREGNGTPLQYSCLENPWMEEPGRLQSMGRWESTRLSDFTFTFHFHALEKEMATHSSVLAWKIPGTGKPGRLQSMGSLRVGHNWSDLAAAAATLWKFNPLPQMPMNWNESYELDSFECGNSTLFHSCCEFLRTDLSLSPLPLKLLLSSVVSVVHCTEPDVKHPDLPPTSTRLCPLPNFQSRLWREMEEWFHHGDIKQLL